MSTIIKNRENVGIDSILAKPLSKGSVRLVDFIVDETNMNPIKDYLDQENSYYVFSLDLYFNTEASVRSNIIGYEVIIRPTGLSRETEILFKKGIKSPESMLLSQTHRFYLKDDYDQITDIGEKDKRNLIKELKKPKIEIVDSEFDPDNKYTDDPVRERVFNTSAEFETSNISEGFEDACRYLLRQNMSPDELIQNSAPRFPVASSLKTNSRTSDLSEQAVDKKVNRVGLPFNTGLVSLDEVRKKIKRNLVSAVDTHDKTYFVENAILQSVGAMSREETIDLGKFATIRKNYFASCREISVHRSLLRGSSKVKFSIKPIFGNDKGRIPTPQGLSENIYLKPKTISFDFPLSELKKQLFKPQVPPTIDIVSNVEGKIIYDVRRNDPSSKFAIVSVKYYNPNTREWYRTHKKRVSFRPPNYDSVTLVHSCFNIDPFKVKITASNGVGSTLGASTSAIVSSHPSKFQWEYNSYDNIKVLAVNRENAIRVCVFPNGYKGDAIYLLREDMSATSDDPKKIIKIKSFRSPEDGTLTFYDRKVIPGRKYRYFTHYTAKQFVNSPILCEKRSTSDFYLVRKPYYKTSKISVSVDRTANGYTPRISVDKNRLFQESLKTLRENNLTNLDERLKESLSKRVSDISEIGYFSIRAFNKKVGTIRDVGVIRTGEEFSNLNDVSRHEMLIFTPAIVNPTFASVTSEISSADIQKIGESNIHSAIMGVSKNLIEFTGVIVSELGKDTSTQEGLIRNAEISMPVLVDLERRQNNRANLKVSARERVPGFDRNRPGLMIEWNASEETEKRIDSFYVVCEYQGKRNVIQSVAYHPGYSSFYYVDTEYYNEVGTKSYQIITKYEDLTLSEPSDPIIYKKTADMPAGLERYISIIPNKNQGSLNRPGYGKRESNISSAGRNLKIFR